jgi:hypothetical protein
MRTAPLHTTTVRLAAIVAFASAALGAQQTPPVTTVPPTTAPPIAAPIPTVLPNAAADTNEVLVVARATDSVRLERDRFLSERRDAEARWGTVREQAERLKSSISDVKSAIKIVEDKEKQAKKDKRDDARALALVEKRQLERSLALLEARYDLRRAQAEHAKMVRDYLDASIRADDGELAYAERRDQVPSDDPSQRGAFQELTNRWLQAQRTRAARAFDVEDRKFKVVEAQIELLKRQRG